MSVIQVVLTIDPNKLPENFQEILKEEQAIVAAWKQEGILSHLFLRPQRNGEILQFKGLLMDEVENRMQSLPFYHIRTNIEYFELLPQF